MHYLLAILLISLFAATQQETVSVNFCQCPQHGQFNSTSLHLRRYLRSLNQVKNRFETILSLDPEYDTANDPHSHIQDLSLFHLQDDMIGDIITAYGTLTTMAAKIQANGNIEFRHESHHIHGALCHLLRALRSLGSEIPCAACSKTISQNRTQIYVEQPWVTLRMSIATIDAIRTRFCHFN